MDVHVYHGPNLNRLEDRDSSHYGPVTLDRINTSLQELAEELDVDLECRQTNREGELVDWIQEDAKQGLVLNAGAYTHTSVAIRDAIELVEYPVVEVHLSNLEQREPFRQTSRIGAVCAGRISGFKIDSYRLGLRAVVRRVRG